jgi:hypothetical protein
MIKQMAGMMMRIAPIVTQDMISETVGDVPQISALHSTIKEVVPSSILTQARWSCTEGLVVTAPVTVLVRERACV